MLIFKNLFHNSFYIHERMLIKIMKQRKLYVIHETDLY